jgi:hypothetical protein
MRVVTDGPVVVSNLVPSVLQHDGDVEQDMGVKAVQQDDSLKKDDGFALRTPDCSTLAQRRRSPSPPKPKAEPEKTHQSVCPVQAPGTENIPASGDRTPHTRPASVNRPASAPSKPVADTPVPRKRHTNQPSTHILIKSLHPRIRDRARSLDPDPLEYYWDFTPHRRYWVKDPLAFETIGLRGVPWMVTNGTLVETNLGLRWAGGDCTYLLRTLDEGFPLPEGMDHQSPIVEVTDEFVRSVQLERWKKDMQNIVPLERPPTPIVEKEDPMTDSFPKLEEVRGLPPTPSSARSLRLTSRSAFNHRRNSSTPASPLSPVLSSSEARPGSSHSDRSVRFYCKKRCRIVELETDAAGVAIEEEGKAVETKIDETENLSDNEGRTSKQWLGKN